MRETDQRHPFNSPNHQLAGRMTNAERLAAQTLTRAITAHCPICVKDFMTVDDLITHTALVHDAPRFTHEDVAVLRWLADYVAADHDTGYHITAARQLADRIAALLPPE